MFRYLEAKAFRNLTPGRWQFASGRHLILGANGAGKTSLLEAIYVLATCRSFRTNRLQECIRHQESSFFLRGELIDGQQLELFGPSEQRERRLNQHRASLAEYLAAQPVVAWTSADLEFLIGAPTARRRFLDRGIVGRRPGTIVTLSRYRQALDEKRKLLQLGPFSDAEIVPWNLLLAQAAAEIIQHRQAFVAKMVAALDALQRETDLGLPKIALRYLPSPREGLEGAATIADLLDRGLPHERVTRQPGSGPHRDELEITWDEHPIRRVASAGERKALGLLMILAFARVLEAEEIRPVYLLDDLDTELDRDRLLQLWRLFPPRDQQVFVTSNRPEVWREADVDHRWSCRRGDLRGDAP